MTPVAKRPYHHGDLRETLLQQAVELIVEKGRDQFTLRELSRRIGVTHGAIYKHFEDKNSLLVALSLKGHSSFLKTMAEATDLNDNLAPTLQNAVKAYVEWSWHHPAEYQVMFGVRLNEDGAYASVEGAIEASFNQIDQIFICRGFDRIRSRTLSVALMTQLHGFSDMLRLRRIRVTDLETAKEYAATLVLPFTLGVLNEQNEI